MGVNLVSSSGVSDQAVVLSSDMITNIARSWLTYAVTTPASIPVLTEIAVGTSLSDDGVLPTQTALENELARADITIMQIDDNKVKIAAIFKDDEAVGTWVEAGLFDTDGDMWARCEFTGVVKANGVVKAFYWSIWLEYTE